MSIAYFRLTNNCNLVCDHCQYSSGPNEVTMSSSDIERVIENLSPDTNLLTLSGGEVFTVRQTLRDTLSFIQSNRQRIIPKAIIDIQTNGYWAINPETAYQILKELYEFGVDELTWSGKDKFHENKGLDLEVVENSITSALVRLAEEVGIPEPIKYGTQGAWFGAYARGRAKHLPPEELIQDGFCVLPPQSRDGYSSPVIDPYGQVYLCANEVSPSIGSAIETPIDALFEHALKDPVVSALIMEGPKGAAIELGVFDLSDEEAYQKNPCAMHEKIFQEFS